MSGPADLVEGVLRREDRPLSKEEIQERVGLASKDLRSAITELRERGILVDYGTDEFGLDLDVASPMPIPADAVEPIRERPDEELEDRVERVLEEGVDETVEMLGGPEYIARIVTEVRYFPRVSLPSFEEGAGEGEAPGLDEVAIARAGQLRSLIHHKILVAKLDALPPDLAAATSSTTVESVEAIERRTLLP